MAEPSSWEGPGSRASSWEEPPGPTPADDLEVVVENALVEDIGAEPADLFIQYCTDLLLRRTLNSKEYCLIMHFAAKAGIQKAALLAKASMQQTGIT